MAAVSSTIWNSVESSGSPVFIYTLTCTADRSNVTQLTLSWKLIATLRGSSSTNHSYALTATTVCGNSTASKQIKDTTTWHAGDSATVTWTNTVSNIAASTTAVVASCAVTTSNPGGTSGTISNRFNVSVPAFLAPTAGTVTVDTETVSKSGTVLVSWSGFRSQNTNFQTVAYRLNMYVNNTHTATLFNGTTGASSYSVNLSGYNLNVHDIVRFDIVCWTGNINNSPPTRTVSSSNIQIKGGTVSINVNGIWHEGIIWINDVGTWREASAVYVNVNNSWKEGV